MKKKYVYLILLLAILTSTKTFAQNFQSNFINYQGVARNGDRELMVNQDIVIQISLKVGAPNIAPAYVESHDLKTDANGVFSLLIGNGATISGIYEPQNWGIVASYIAVSINGLDIGTTELRAVPYAINAGNVKWGEDGIDGIENINRGGVEINNGLEVNNGLEISGDLTLNGGVSISKIVTDGTFEENSDISIPTEKAVKTYVDDAISAASGSGLDADSDPENEIDVTRRHGLLIGDDGIVDGLVGSADGQVAKWDAALGNWVAGNDNTGGAGSSLWTDNAGDIYFDSGKVGVGVMNPSGKLQVSQNSGSAPFLVLETTSGNTADISYRKTGVNESWDQMATIESDEATSAMNTTFYDGGTAHNIMTLRGNRRVGINNYNPQTALDVAGQIRSSDLSGGGNVIADANGNLTIGALSSGGSSVWSEDANGISYDIGNVGIGGAASTHPLNITSDNRTLINLTSSEAENYIAFNNADGYKGYVGIFNGNSDMDFGTGFLNGTGKVHLVTNAIPKLTVAAAGNVGIGTTTPTAKLEVDGDIKTSGELHRPSTGDTNMVPIAYGTVNIEGDPESGSGNYSVSTGSIAGLYSIRIAGESYTNSKFTTVASVVNAPGFLTVYDGIGTLTIQTKDITGTNDQKPFSFVTYKN